MIDTAARPVFDEELNLFRDQMKVGQNGSTANGQTGVSTKQW